MKKLKLLFAACALMGAGTAWAQEDVTSTYLTNADFSQSTAIDNHVCGYDNDDAKKWNTTYYHQQQVTGWTIATDNTDGRAAAVFAYGSDWKLQGNNVGAPATGPDGATGNALGMFAVWTGTVQYTQEVTLPAGNYTLTFPVYNASGATVINNNLFGFVPNSGTAYYCCNNTFALQKWTTMSVTFTLKEETTGKISVGYTDANVGSGATPMLFLDKVVITSQTDNTDQTAKVSLTDWKNASGGASGEYNNTVSTADGRSGKMREFYGSSDAGLKLTQTVTGLPTGVYNIELYATSQWERNEHGATTQMPAERSDVAYLFATGKNTVQSWMNVRNGPGYTTPGRYNIDNVSVTDGSLTIGMQLAVGAVVQWETIQIKSLTRIGDVVDLEALTEAYNTALTNAKAVDQTAKMATSILAALKSAIIEYNSVDKTSATALTTATEALNKATANANTSIASYAIIASGGISNNSVDGWTNTGNGSLEVNNWSVEGDNDGTGMTNTKNGKSDTNFIQSWIWKGDDSKTYLGNGQVYYTLAGLEPGEVYYAQALVRAYSEGGNVPNGPNFFINDVVTDMTTNGTSFEYSGMKGYYGTLGGAATVGIDGKITVGVVIENANYNWVAFKNVSIQSMDDAFDAAVAKVTALESTIPATAYATAYAVVTANSGSNYPTTAAGFETAIAAIEAAAATAAAYVEPYAAWNALKPQANALAAVANDNSEANSTLAAAITTQDKAVEQSSTPGDITTATATLKTAMTTYVGLANPVGDGVKFDCTFMLTNPNLDNFANGSKPAGWYCDYDTSIQFTNSQVNRNASSADGTKTTTYEFWTGSAVQTGDFTVYQKVTLPEGTYNMSCWAFASANGVEGATNSAVYFYANDTQGSVVASDNLVEASISFVNASEQEVKVGLKACSGNEFRWMGIGYVELYKVPAAAAVVLDESVAYVEATTAADVKLTKTIYEGWNTVVLPFSMTSDEVATVFGAGKLYAFTGADAGSLNFSEASALSAHTPYLFKANDAKNISSETISGRTITVSTNGLKTDGADYNFVGTYTPYAKGESPIVVDADYVLGADANFHKATVKNALKAFRAYIQANKDDEPAPARLSIVIDGETTAIEAIDGRVLSNDAIFNLAGQKVQNAQKGIFIQNGKKVVK